MSSYDDSRLAAGQDPETAGSPARVGTVVGLVGFIWGASGFYMALQGAMERFFPGPHAHDPVRGRLRGPAGGSKIEQTCVVVMGPATGGAGS